ncbi:hypothetical protein PENTCL1PPCAC_19913, partial [Pristionchus entomophagus]
RTPAAGSTPNLLMLVVSYDAFGTIYQRFRRPSRFMPALIFALCSFTSVETELLFLKRSKHVDSLAMGLPVFLHASRRRGAAAIHPSNRRSGVILASEGGGREGRDSLGGERG